MTMLYILLHVSYMTNGGILLLCLSRTISCSML